MLEDKITRLEIIDYTKSIDEGGGRTVIFYDKTKKIELDVQDMGETLKIFITNRERVE